MSSTLYDLTIIGGGSGGLTAARLAAALGAIDNTSPHLRDVMNKPA